MQLARFPAIVASLLESYLIPLGLLALLTGMFWAGDRGLYHRLFYVLVALPALVLLLMQRQIVADLLQSPIFRAFAAFAAYVILSIAWSGTEDAAVSLVKRPLYVLLLFAALFATTAKQPEMVARVVRFASAIALVAAALSLAAYLLGSRTERLSGYGALYNPLLTSHVFGFFLMLWLAHLLSGQCRQYALTGLAVVLLSTVLLATGSRTPLHAVAATVIWLAALSGGRRAVMTCAGLAVAGALVAVFFHDTLLSRGFSYRPDIWADALRQIQQHLLFGHGYYHPLGIHVDALGMTFSEPHNMLLSVLYEEGLAGLTLWLLMYGTALAACWKYRRHYAVFVCAAPVMYGLMAGMTEGGIVIARPKEHWFLIWIPLALLAASVFAVTRTGREHQHG